MNFIPWNIVRKDFRLTRPYLLAWWGILVIGAVMTVWNLYQIMQAPGEFYNNARSSFSQDYNYREELPYWSSWLFMGLDLALLTVLVDLIFKADSPIDERAEWRTRPVSGLGILRAKFFYLGLFCYLVPAFIQTLEHISLGSDWVGCLLGLAHLFVLQSFFVAIVASAAVLFQRTFSGLLVFCGIAVVIYLIDGTEYFGITIDNPSSPFREGLPIAWLALVILALTGFGVTALMYAGRRRKTGALALGGGVLTALLVYFTWMKIPHDSPVVAPQLDNRVQMAFGANPARRNSYNYEHPSLIRLELATQVTFQDESNTVLQPTEIQSHVDWPSLKLPPFDYHRATSGDFALFNLPSALAAAGYGRLLVENDSSFNYPAATLFMSKAQIAQGMGQPARWQGTLNGEVGRLVVDWDIPYVQDPTWTHNLSLFKLETRYQQSFGWELGFTLWEASSTNLPYMAATKSEYNSQFVLLYNPTKKEALVSGMYDGEDNDRESLSVYSISKSYFDFDLGELFGKKFRGFMDDAPPGLDPTDWPGTFEAWERDQNALIHQHHQELADWLAGARLMELHFVPDHTVYNTAKFDSVQIITPELLKSAHLDTP